MYCIVLHVCMLCVRARPEDCIPNPALEISLK